MTNTSGVLDTSWIHRGWSSYAMVRFRLPDGTEIDREVEHHGHAVAVLPYDPDRRVAMLVQQPRVGPMFTGEATFLIEAPAGKLEVDDPEAEVRREALEEVGLQLRDLEFIVDSWSMASVSTERIKLYLAAYSQADQVARGGGAEDEHEAIRLIEMPLQELARRSADSSLTDMKTMLLALSLQVRYPELFTA